MKYTLITLLILTAACSGKPTAAIESLQKIQAATKTGVTLNRYHELVSDAAFNCEKACPDKYPKDSPCREVRSALYYYQRAATDWREYGSEMKELIDLSWERADKNMEKLK